MNKKKIFYVILFLVVYVGLIAQTAIYDHFLERKLATFDLNNDGIFSPEEQTPEQQKYSNMVIGDGGRNVFTPIIGIFISFVVTGSAFVALETYSYFSKRKKQK